MKALIGSIVRWLKELTCKHKYQIFSRTKYVDHIQYLFVCSKCGKLKGKLKRKEGKI